jgi:hypothetical protein
MVKTTINLPSDLMDRMKGEARRQGISVTELVRTSVEFKLYILEEGRMGGSIFVKGKGGQMTRVVQL